MELITFKRIILLLGIFLTMPLVSSAHFIVGQVNNSLDGMNANGFKITLWNPADGISDNLTDTIGPTGNSGANNIYFFDCELLNGGCSVGDTLNAKVLNNGSNYVTEIASLIVTGAGFDMMPGLRLNSLPNATLNYPTNYANISNQPFNFTCTANDLDGNLANITLYGNWSGGWHANETKSVSEASPSANFTKTLAQGIYEWSCLATDNLSISRFAQENRTITVDLTPPTIDSVGLNLSGDLCGTQENVRVNCTVTDALSGVKNVTIEASAPSGKTNYTTSVLSGDTYFADILLNEIGVWNFSCIAQDYAGNTANLSSENLNIHTTNTELTISSEDISFSNSDPIENSPVTINATIHNQGCGDANNFLVGFFEGDPESSGLQINGNQTILVLGLSNTTTNVTWNAKIGLANIFVYADLNNSISEDNETNNKANKTIEVNAWQDFYGNVTIDKLLGGNNTNNLSLWFNESSISGNLFIADTESNIDWSSLKAIGKNITGADTTDDFSEIDSILNMQNFNDSVSNIFTTDGNTPKATEDFLVHQQDILNVPIVNSTNNTNFITGIMWDSSDDSNSEYDSSEKEDLIFVAKINKASQGKYGVYDYEIRIPARLREYYTADTSNVFIYFDLN